MCLEILHSDSFCCMWYLLYLEILYSHWVSALLFQKVAACHFCCQVHSNWLSGLKKEASIFSNGLKQFCNIVISNKFVTELF